MMRISWATNKVSLGEFTWEWVLRIRARGSRFARVIALFCYATRFVLVKQNVFLLYKLSPRISKAAFIAHFPNAFYVFDT